MSITMLDHPQVIRSVFDETTQSLRTVPGSTTAFEIELSADDGDSAKIQGRSKDASKVSITSSNTGVVVPALDCEGMKSFQIYVKTTTAITTPQVLTLQLSPHSTDDVWFSTTCTVTPSSTLNTVVASSLFTGIAKRARVSIASAISDGGADIYLNVQGN